jgi:nitrogenase delta subunit
MVENLVGYIMRKCLWQFHSRAWDRERQNAGIIGMATRILLGQDISTEDRSERCYMADAVIMARGFLCEFPALASLSPDEIRDLMGSLKERLDFLTIRGSLNEELTDPKY